mmetsp:Transcript_24692/g.54960  ORF Transcript_24692/g.54960 Transcript_24692/m.54960 type:complete len:249 (+) Transcript_24692:1145-1891(+)
MSSYPPSVSPLWTTASTMQPKVMLVGRIWRLLISPQQLQTPATSLAKPYALMRLPNVCDPQIFTLSLACSSFSFIERNSGLPMRTQASTTEERRTSSIGSSMERMSPIVFSTSSGADLTSNALRRIEQVTWFGLIPTACISSMMPQIFFWPPAPPFPTKALTSSLNVTRFGCRPAAAISSMRARAFSKLPLWRWALIIVLYVTTSRCPASFVFSIHSSAALMSWHSTQASSTVLYTTLLMSPPVSWRA